MASSATTDQSAARNDNQTPRNPRNQRNNEGGADSGANPGRGRGGNRTNRRPKPRGRGGNARMDGPRVTLPVGQAAPGIKPQAQTSDEDVDDSGLCFICADPVRYSAVPPCNHSTCHICSLRMRALYKSKFCTHCRTESEYVIFTKDAEKRFEEFEESDIVARNDTLGIKYDDQAICDDATLLLRYNCPAVTCDRACMSWPDLHRHVRVEHKLVMCDLCTRNKKVFTHEHELFTPAELRRHERHGDDVPGSENQSGFRGHPDCRFCNRRFYSGDELYEHCRHSHERCHICDRMNPGSPPAYFINYAALEEHFKDSHFACTDAECLEKKFVVFENEIDLKAHQLEAHPNGLSKEARRDARRIDMAQFQSREYNQAPAGRRGRGRGFQGDDAGPVRTEQNMTRAEIAYHRTQQLALQREPDPVRTPPPPPQPQHSTRPPPQNTDPPLPPARREVPGSTPAPPREVTFPPLAPSRPQPAATPSRPTPAPANAADVRTLRHTAVIERASNMLRNDATKIQLFRTNISQFRSGAITGSNLVDKFWGLFDVSAKNLGTLINELADLYEDDNKKQELLKAWNSWKAINEDYPPIAGAQTPSASTSASANRVRALKSSTAKSARSAAARQTSWGTATVAPTPSSSSTPSSTAKPGTTFRTPAQINPARQGKGAVSATPWVSPQVAAPAATGRAKDEFPSLPQQRKPAGWTPIPAKGRAQGNTNVWAPGSSSSGGEVQQQEGEEVQQETGRKKKAKQKTLLFHVGL